MHPAGPVTVEPVESRAQLRRFAEVPFVLLGSDPRWSAGVRAYEQWRHDARRHPYFDRGDAAFHLARRSGRPVGRIAAHVDGTSDRGWFGMFDVPDDAAVTAALVEAAAGWLREQGATTMVGPVTWTSAEDFGVLVEGFEHPAATGRPWHPRWYAEQLLAVGGQPGERRATHHVPTAGWGAEVPRPSAAEPPPHAGGYADPALVLDGIAAVPDVAPLLAGASVRSAWRLARRARERPSDTAVCVRCEGDPEVLVPRLLGACRWRGYRTLLSPWSPDGAAPDRLHQVFRLAL